MCENKNYLKYFENVILNRKDNMNIWLKFQASMENRIGLSIIYCLLINKKKHIMIKFIHSSLWSESKIYIFL